MQRARHPSRIRNKIDLKDPAQVRAWTRRLRISVDALCMMVERVGNSVAAVTKEVELQRIGRQPCPIAPIKPATPLGPVEVNLSTQQ